MKLQDRILDALDDAPLGTIEGEVTFYGPLATVQWVASFLGVSDTHARKAIHQLFDKGLVQIFDGFDPNAKTRRLYITGDAS